MDTEDSFSTHPNEARLQLPLKPPSTLEIPAYFEEFPVIVKTIYN
jgi:hypothetical protein